MAATLAVAVSATSALAARPPAAANAVAAAERPGRLTNLDHLDYLGDRVAPPKQAGHTTYQLAERPELGVLWTYADKQADGSYKRIGGGPYDAGRHLRAGRVQRRRPGACRRGLHPRLEADQGP